MGRRLLSRLTSLSCTTNPLRVWKSIPYYQKMNRNLNILFYLTFMYYYVHFLRHKTCNNTLSRIITSDTNHVAYYLLYNTTREAFHLLSYLCNLELFGKWLDPLALRLSQGGAARCESAGSCAPDARLPSSSPGTKSLTPPGTTDVTATV